MYHVVGLITHLHQLMELAIFLDMRFGILNHAVDFCIAQTGRRFNNNRLLFAGSFVTRRNIENAVGINIKSHFNLRHAAP